MEITNKLRVEYHVIDRCNLNCKACSHFSNLKSTRAEIPKNLNKIKADFKKVYELTNNGDPDYLGKVTLMGGEPLLYKQLIPCIDYVKSLFPHIYDEGPLQLITNGILVPKQKPEFFECLRRNKVRVCVSMYKSDESGVKINYDAIFKILAAQKIDWYWYSTFSKDEAKFSNKWLHTEFNENYKEYAYDCHWRKSCTQLVDEKIYLCPLIAYFKYFDSEFKDKHKFIITDEDFIDLKKINSFDELQVEREKIPHFCGYCRGHNAIVDDWSITKRSIDEYVFDEPKT